MSLNENKRRAQELLDRLNRATDDGLSHERRPQSPQERRCGLCGAKDTHLTKYPGKGLVCVPCSSALDAENPALSPTWRPKPWKPGASSDK